MADGSVVDQHVNATAPVHHRRDGVRVAIVIADVELPGEHRSARCLDFGACDFERFRVALQQDDVRALCRKLTRDRQPKALSSPGDDGDLAFQQPHDASLPACVV